MSNTTPPPPPAFPPPAPPSKKNRTNAIIIGSAALLIAAIVTTGVVVVNTRDGNTPASAGSSSPADETVTAATEPEPEPEDTGPEILGLTDGVEYEDGVEVALSDYKRGVSSEYAAPASTSYVAFTVKINNKSDAVVDVGTGYVMCFYGEESREAEQIFDDGLDGMPSMKLRPGRVAKATVACELPKGEEYLQVELAPSMESAVAIFAGNVK